MASNSSPRKPGEKNDKGAALGLAQDRLNKKQLRNLYNITYRQLQVDPSLFRLFQQAYDEQWDQNRWDSEIEQLPWYRQNKASVRQYMMAQAEGGADWQAKKDETYEFVRRTSMEMGVNLSADQLEDLTDQTLMFGWGESGQEYQLKRAIVEQPGEGKYGGDIRMNAQTLQALALANGVKYDPGWYESAGKSVAAGLSNPEDWETQIREQAAQKFSAFAPQIMAGQNVTDLVSPYRNLMAEEWEINPNEINLEDPTLLSAFGYDDKGVQAPMNLGDFTRMLRKDPRWMNTDKAQNKVSSITNDVLQMFGIRG